MEQTESVTKEASEPEKFVAKPDSSELKPASWQEFEQSVYIYPEKVEQTYIAEADVVKKKSENALMEIQDIVQDMDERSDEEKILLKQLIDIPSEVVISNKSLANELTCRLCSTIIYRPLINDKNL